MEIIGFKIRKLCKYNLNFVTNNKRLLVFNLIADFPSYTFFYLYKMSINNFKSHLNGNLIHSTRLNLITKNDFDLLSNESRNGSRKKRTKPC